MIRKFDSLDSNANRELKLSHCPNSPKRLKKQFEKRFQKKIVFFFEKIVLAPKIWATENTLFFQPCLKAIIMSIHCLIGRFIYSLKLFAAQFRQKNSKIEFFDKSRNFGRKNFRQKW